MGFSFSQPARQCVPTLASSVWLRWIWMSLCAALISLGSCIDPSQIPGDAVSVLPTPWDGRCQGTRGQCPRWDAHPMSWLPPWHGGLLGDGAARLGDGMWGPKATEPPCPFASPLAGHVNVVSSAIPERRCFLPLL